MLVNSDLCLAGTIHKFSSCSDRTTMNFVRCYLDRSSIQRYINVILNNLTPFVDIKVITGFIHKSIENYDRDEINENLNRYKGLIFSAKNEAQIELLLEILENRIGDTGINLSDLYYLQIK